MMTERCGLGDGASSSARWRAGGVGAPARAETSETSSIAAQMIARRGWKKANRRVEVILKTAVPGLGDVDEVARVRPGRARNHLVPGKMATYVNEEKLAAATERLRVRAAKEAEGEEAETGGLSAAEAEAEAKVRSIDRLERPRAARWSDDSANSRLWCLCGDDWNFLWTRVSEDSSLGSDVYTTFPLAV